MMSFNRKIFYAISVITFIVFNVIAFIVPINRNADFWVGYTFVCLTILWIVIALNVIIKDTDSLNDIFLKLPVTYHLIAYLAISVVLNLIIIFLPDFSIRVAVLFNVVILGIHMVLVLTAMFVGNTVSNSEKKVEEKIHFIQQVLVDVQIYESSTLNPLLQKLLKELEETIRYSDPISNDSLIPLEQNILYQLATLGELIDNGNDDKAIMCVNQVKAMFEQRNKKCKILKQRG